MTKQEFRTKLETLGLSQSEVSRIMAVDGRSVRRWACGERPVPGFAIAFLGLLEACPPALKLAKKLAATALQAGAQEAEADASEQSPRPDRPA